MRNMLHIFLITSLISLGLIGWVALLNFPWQWFFKSFVIIQSLFFAFILLSEYSAQSVNGASGWMFIFFCFVEGFGFVILAILRLVIAMGQALN